jgi:hypothetical protein
LTNNGSDRLELRLDGEGLVVTDGDDIGATSPQRHLEVDLPAVSSKMIGEDVAEIGLGPFEAPLVELANRRLL